MIQFLPQQPQQYHGFIPHLGSFAFTHTSDRLDLCVCQYYEVNVVYKLGYFLQYNFKVGFAFFLNQCNNENSNGTAVRN